MKALPNLSRLIAACLAVSASARAADPVTALNAEGKSAYERGDLPAAKAKFGSVQSFDPKNATAAKFLELIRAKEAAKGGGTERVVATLVVPSVQFREAELSAVLEALKQQVSKLTGGKQSVNFVALLSEEQAKIPVTLSLSNVPFTEVLKYIGTLANITFTFDKYAIMVRPTTSASSEPKTEEAPKVKGL